MPERRRRVGLLTDQANAQQSASDPKGIPVRGGFRKGTPHLLWRTIAYRAVRPYRHAGPSRATQAGKGRQPKVTTKFREETSKKTARNSAVSPHIALHHRIARGQKARGLIGQ
jgi:hypothetical protein